MEEQPIKTFLQSHCQFIKPVVYKHNEDHNIHVKAVKS